MNDVGLPVFVARAQVASAIHVVIQIARFSDGSRRVQTISEVLDLGSDGNYRVQDLYRFEATGRGEDGKIQGKLTATGARPRFSSEAYEMGYGDRVKLTKALFVPK
jgi:pilus assembly protein CpaF